MKTFICGCLVVVLIVVGCTTTSQRAAFNTIGALELTASQAIDGYDTALIKGMASTNNAVQIENDFNQFQHAASVAASVAQNGTNALAPASLTLEAANLSALIASSISTNK